MDDKFILIGLDDERSISVAEVLKNPTCKKILNFLGDVKEASEKDISDALKMPLNTVEYNLKKLVKSGLTEKAKNFFWSVKGRKIPMYKLAKKHIIISPNKKPNLDYLKSILPVILTIAFAIFLISFFMLSERNKPEEFELTKLNQFNSQGELEDFIKENSGSAGFGEQLFRRVMKSGDVSVAMAESSGGSASDYSTTNIQVEGVDEADIVKNDGKYIYLANQNKITIVDGYPAKDMNIVSEIELEAVRNIYVNDDKLIVFADNYGIGVYRKGAGILSVDESYSYPRYQNSLYIYDISDKKNPIMENKFEMEGSYINSRMIGDYVYVISTKYIDSGNSYPPLYAVNGAEKKVSAQEVYYFDYPDTNYVFTSISAINVKSREINNEIYLLGSSGNIYVSRENIYLTYQKAFNYENYADKIAEQVYFILLSEEHKSKIEDVLDSGKEVYRKLDEMQKIINDYSNSLKGKEKAKFDKELSERLEEFEINIQKEMEKTIIHKISLDKENINYEEFGEVPGNVLNQFSMDEYDGYFRIATTTGDLGGSKSLNHLYILDNDLKITGSLENLAEGERIYSVRFMGERAYVVTFKKVDPLFVIDLKNPEEPKVLGYLKITGYSDYLHPYDENHIIGIGKETAGGTDDFSWYQGVKVSLFDVSDVENPVEVGKIEIGDRGTSSDALYEHKAVSFDKYKEILILPISLYEINRSEFPKEVPDEAYGEFVWQGVYVLNISPEEISLRGKITHDNINIEEDYDMPVYGLREEGMNYPDWRKAIKRSLYIDDSLYTISEVAVKANQIKNLNETKTLEIF